MENENLDLDEIFGDFEEINNESPFSEPAGQPNQVSSVPNPSSSPNEAYNASVEKIIEQWRSEHRNQGEQLRAEINRKIEDFKRITAKVEVLKEIPSSTNFFNIFNSIYTNASDIYRYRDQTNVLSSIVDSKFNELKTELLAVGQMAQAPRVIFTTPRNSDGRISRQIEIHGHSENIILEEPDSHEKFEFGAFDIVVTITENRDRFLLQYKIKALTPHPPASQAERPTLIHPHVMMDSVCLGDARHPIANAARDIRISDIYDVLFTLLKTYNPASPYMNLREWNLLRCRSCNQMTSREKIYKCSICNAFKCEHCGKEMIKCSHKECVIVNCKGHSKTTDKNFVSACKHCGIILCGAHMLGKRIHACAKKTEEELLALQMKRLTGLKDGLMNLGRLIATTERNIPIAQAVAQPSANDLDNIFNDFMDDAQDIFTVLTTPSRVQPSPVVVPAISVEEIDVMEVEEVEVEQPPAVRELGNPNPTRGWIRT